MNIRGLAGQANKKFQPYWPGGAVWYLEEIERFAKLVAAHEREECAKLCDEMYDDSVDGHPNWQYGVAIRARSK